MIHTRSTDTPSTTSECCESAIAAHQADRGIADQVRRRRVRIHGTLVHGAALPKWIELGLFSTGLMKINESVKKAPGCGEKNDTAKRRYADVLPLAQSPSKLKREDHWNATT